MGVAVQLVLYNSMLLYSISWVALWLPLNVNHMADWQCLSLLQDSPTDLVVWTLSVDAISAALSVCQLVLIITLPYDIFTCTQKLTKQPP